MKTSRLLSLPLFASLLACAPSTEATHDAHQEANVSTTSGEVVEATGESAETPKPVPPTRKAETFDPAELVEVFKSGEEGYHTFRIPSVIQAPNGDLLAFCEGRKNSASDTGDIDTVMKRSTDGGQTWSALKGVFSDGANTCGNPCPVIDWETDTIHLVITHNEGVDDEEKIVNQTSIESRYIWTIASTDNGETWSKPKEITASIKPPKWTWYATGPGAGIQLTRGKNPGRLVIPCDHITAESKKYYSHVIYSDDHGKSWWMGGTTPWDDVNECEVVELDSGRLMLNMRNYNKQRSSRQVAFSDDQGLSWRDQGWDEELIEPTCQASLRRIRWPEGEEPGVIAFTNPADEEERKNMTLRASFDEGENWTFEQVLYEGSSAYSCLVALKDGDAGCLFEADDYGRIVFARIPIEGLTP